MVEPNNHEVLDLNFTCLLCGFNGPCNYHGEHDELIGVSLECSKCKNYILYQEDGKNTKEEFYLDDGSWVVRDFEDGVCRFYLDDRGFDGVEIPMLEDSEIPTLKKRIELFITFS